MSTTCRVAQLQECQGLSRNEVGDVAVAWYSFGYYVTRQEDWKSVAMFINPIWKFASLGTMQISSPLTSLRILNIVSLYLLFSTSSFSQSGFRK